MNTVIAWFRSKNITSHTIAALAIAAAGLITTDQQVRDFIIQSLQAHPKIAADIVLAASIILKYSRNSSPTGAATNVAVDKATANPPAAH
jgi:hypothetical protein